MEEFILKNEETFAEFPDGLLLVKENCNLMYVRIGKRVFIAREFLSKISGNTDCVEYKIKYYDVKTNENILTFNFSKTDIENESLKKCQKEDIEIIPLDKVLNIKVSSVTYLKIQDIENIIDFKGITSQKTHSVI